MATKKEFTIEELQAQYEALGAELEERKKAEAEKKKAKLKADQKLRYDAVVEAYERFEELRSKYVDDYGYFTFETQSKHDGTLDWFWKTIGLM